MRGLRVAALGRAVAILLGASAVGEAVQAVLQLDGVSTAPVAVLNIVLYAVIAPTFIVWCYRVRKNAGMWGPQRRSQGWTIGAWFVPGVNLWFPVQIMRDVWRTSAGDRVAADRAARLGAGWWTCWVLAWVIGLHNDGTVRTVGPGGRVVVSDDLTITPGANFVSSLCVVAAAVLLALLVGRVTRMQVVRSRA